MLNVCIPYESSLNTQMDLDYVLSNFQVDKIYLWSKEGHDPYATNVVGNGTIISELSELPNVPVVLLAPINGYEIQGEEDLTTFSHPESCTYMVGSNHRHLLMEDCNIDFDYKVYIPTDTNDNMFNYVALGVCLYDRKVKNG